VKHRQPYTNTSANTSCDLCSVLQTVQSQYPTQKTRMRTSFDPELELPKLQRWFAENQHPSRQQVSTGPPLDTATSCSLSLIKDFVSFPFTRRLRQRQPSDHCRSLVGVAQSCTSRAHRTVCEDVCSSACTRACDATARPGM
jgi:hypothetical protein